MLERSIRQFVWMVITSLIAWSAPAAAIAAEKPSAAPATKPATSPAKASALPPGVRVVRDVHYGDAAGNSNLLDLYLPAKASDSPLPLVVYIHGGGWRAGDKGSPCIHAAFMVEQGYAFASINYRYSQQAVFPAQLDDCKGAVRWLRSHAKEQNIDPDRIGIWGSSAGAHLAALVAMTAGDPAREGVVGGNAKVSSGVKCAVDFYGPSDFVNMEAHAAAAKIVRDPTKISVLLGGTPMEKPELAVAASPVRHVSKSTPPFLILHGGADKTVPLAQSEALAEALKQEGVEVKLTVVPGAIHGAPFSGAKEREEIKVFFNRHLKAPAAAQ
jgi:acetyl esterase/lipase